MENRSITPPVWMDPRITGINRLPARATLYPYPDESSARGYDRLKSPWVRMLNGTWKFTLVDRPESAPHDFCAPGTDDSGWSAITVPGCWTMQGFDYNHYTNVNMPFPEQPPRVPEKNPTGLYRTRFSIPQEWAGRRIVLHFGGVETAGFVYVNGAEVGMTKDSRTPSEFDVTAVAGPGDNLLAVKVLRWSDGSFLEDQDHWRMAGIHRDVYVYATGGAWIGDVFAAAGLEPDLKTGTLAVKIRIGAADDKPGQWDVAAILAGGPRLSVWRGATDNDGIKAWANVPLEPRPCRCSNVRRAISPRTIFLPPRI